jgi:hypothetical protein
MNRRQPAALALIAMLAYALLVPGCATVRGIGDTALALQRLQFKLDGAHPGTLAGVDLAKVTDPGSLSTLDGLKLAQAYASGEWPFAFTLDVAVRNPNDGSGDGTARVGLLESLAWTLELDGVETISGDIPEPVSIPGTGETVILPLRMSLDLYRFFGDRGYEGLLNLALAVAGSEGSTSQVVLSAVPTVSVGGIPLRYPGRIRIVDARFGDS